MLHRFVLSILAVEVVLASDMRMPPDIITGPTTEILYRNSDDVRLDCVSTGYPKPRFDWRRNGVLLDPNSPEIRWIEPSITGTIEIVRATHSSMGYYQCLAENNYGTAMSNVSFVQIATLETFTPGNPKPYYVTEGDNHMLPCEQLKSVPSSTFTWFLALSTADENPVKLVVNERIQIDALGNLHFSFVKKEDEQNKKLYKCHVFNSFLDLVIGGSYANLSVTAVNPIPTKAPSVAFSTESPVIGLIGGSVKIECLFYGNPVPAISWKKLNGNLPPIPRWSVDSKTYYTEATISSLIAGDAGDYICTGTGDNTGFANATIALIIEAKPTFPPIANHLDSKNITEGESISLTCNASAIPSASLTWYRDTVPLDGNTLPPKYRLSSDGLELTITGLCKNCSSGTSDLTVIQCNASNTHGYAFAQGFVNVISKTVITDESVSIIWEPLVEVTFPCRATSDDITPVTHTWFFNDQPVVYDSNVVFDPVLQQLHITTANDEDQGQGRVGTYRCQVTNGYSQATVEHFLVNPSGTTTRASTLATGTTSAPQYCGTSYYYGPSGVISSPNYPGNYSNYQSCNYYVDTSSSSSSIAVVFTAFDTDQCCDYVTISCPEIPLYPSLRYSGPFLPQPFSIPRCSQAVVNFITDGSTVSTGFSLNYYVNLGDCGDTVYTESHDYISSPNYPNSHDNNLNCSNIIWARLRSSFTINFLDMDLEECCDFVELSCIDNAEYGRHRFSGSSIPPKQDITGCTQVLVWFHSDDSLVKPGFNLEYFANPDPDDLSQRKVSSNGMPNAKGK